MAYAFTSASSQSLSAGSAPVTGAPFTFHVIGKPTNTSGNKPLIALDRDGVTPNSFPFLMFASSVLYFASDQGASNIDTPASSVTSGAFYSCAGIMPSTTEISVVLNGGTKYSKSSGVTNISTPSTLRIGVYRVTVGYYAYMSGDIAEAAIWNVALTDDEIASLAKGFKPTRVRPQSLVFYAPLIRTLQDTRGGLTITNNNSATVADHPRVY